jgi:hypothetical protein
LTCPHNRRAVGVGVVGGDLGVDVGGVPDQALHHRGDLRGGALAQLGVHAHALAFDVPVDHHPGAAVPGVPLGHQVGFPGAEPFGVRRARGAGSPPSLVSAGEGFVGDLGDCPAEAFAADEHAADPAQLRLGDAVIAGVHHPAYADVGAEREQHQQQPLAQLGGWDVLPAGDAAELGVQVGQPVGLGEHVEQADHAPTADYLLLQRLQGLRRWLRRLLGHRDPDLSAT